MDGVPGQPTVVAITNTATAFSGLLAATAPIIDVIAPYCLLPCLQVGKDVMHFRPPDEQNDHKVTCGVNVGVLQQVLDLINASLEAAGVVANIITSGTGEQ